MVVILVVAIPLGFLARVLKRHGRRVKNVNEVNIVVQTRKDGTVKEGEGLYLGGR
jgi:hypothetical protein